jgi:hypothetical protein
VSVVFIVVFCAVAWFASPKGENQTYVYPLLPMSIRAACGRSSALFARSLCSSVKNQPANTTNPQCLALNPHPLCLELLAHVGYVSPLNYNFSSIGRKSAKQEC